MPRKCAPSPSGLDARFTDTEIPSRSIRGVLSPLEWYSVLVRSTGVNRYRAFTSPDAPTSEKMFAASRVYIRHSLCASSPDRWLATIPPGGSWRLLGSACGHARIHGVVIGRWMAACTGATSPDQSSAKSLRFEWEQT